MHPIPETQSPATQIILNPFRCCCDMRRSQAYPTQVAQHESVVTTPLIRRLISDQIATHQKVCRTPVGNQSAPARQLCPVVQIEENPRREPSDVTGQNSRLPPHTSNVLSPQNEPKIPLSSVSSASPESKSRLTSGQEEADVSTPDPTPSNANAIDAYMFPKIALATSPTSKSTATPPTIASASAPLQSITRRNPRLDVVAAPFEVCQCGAFNMKEKLSDHQNVKVSLLTESPSPPSRRTLPTFHLSPSSHHQPSAVSVTSRLERIEAVLSDLLTLEEQRGNMSGALEEWARLQIRKERLQARRDRLMEELQECENEKAAKKKLVSFLETSQEVDEFNIAIDTASLYFKRQLDAG